MVRHIGRISYGIYVYHLFVVEAFREAWPGFMQHTGLWRLPIFLLFELDNNFTR